MDTMRAMRVFVRTLELGSLSAAARAFGTTQSNVSKILARLEQELAVRLVERSTRGLAPTEQGLRFQRDARALLEQYDAAVSGVQGMNGSASGLLRINAPVGLGQHRISAMVQEFMREQPGIEVELVLNDRFVDLVEEGVDIVFRLGGTLPPDAVGRHLASLPRLLAAAPAYLERCGVPAAPDELERHAFVRFAWTPSNTLALVRACATLRVPVSSRYRVNNALAIREALALGSGIGLCPEWLVGDLLDSGALVRVLPEWSAPPQDLYLLYPSRQYQPLRARLFVDFAIARFAALPGFAPPGPGRAA